jgi:hypothetical protein
MVRGVTPPLKRVMNYYLVILGGRYGSVAADGFSSGNDLFW